MLMIRCYVLIVSYVITYAFCVEVVSELYVGYLIVWIIVITL